MVAKLKLKNVNIDDSVQEYMNQSDAFARFVDASLRRFANGDWGDRIDGGEFDEAQEAYEDGGMAIYGYYDFPDYVDLDFDDALMIVRFPEDGFIRVEFENSND